MPLFKRQLAQKIRGSQMQKEDWAFLVFDSDAARLFVEHQWRHDDNATPEGERPVAQHREEEINDFLAAADALGRAELIALIMQLFTPGALGDEP